MHPDFITQDHDKAEEQVHQRKKSVMDELNNKLDPKRRPSIVELSNQGLIPQNWLLELYGLADEVRKRHKKMDSAILDLKTQLNVPPILADVVARDVLEEMETVDPYLGVDDNGGNEIKEKSDDEVDEDEDEDEEEVVDKSELLNGRRASNDANADEIYRLKKEIETLNRTVSEQSNKIVMLSNENDSLQETIQSMKQTENGHLTKISSLEKKTSMIDDQNEEITRLREEYHSSELYKLDSKATEIELSKARSDTRRLRDENHQLKVFLQQIADEKIELISKTSAEINKLRGFVRHYQKYYQQQQQIKQQQSSSILTNIFG